MPFAHRTPFGTTFGNVTDEERINNGNSQNALAQNAQLQAIQAEMADRAAGRTFQGGQNDKLMAFQGGMFDKNAGLQKDLDQSSTTRAMGVVNAQMAPSLMGAQDEHARYMEGADTRGLKNQLQANVLREAMGRFGGAAPAGDVTTAANGAKPTGTSGLPDESLMFLAFGGNPAELAQIKRQEGMFNVQREDAKDNRSYSMALELLKSENPQARALGATMLGKTQQFGGTDTGVLGNALAPRRAPEEAVNSKLSLRSKLDDLMGGVTSGQSALNQDDVIGTSQVQMQQLIASLVKEGVPEEEAQAYVKQYLEKNAPKTGFFSDPISSLVDTFLPGTPMGDTTRASKIRKGLGLRTE